MANKEVSCKEILELYKKSEERKEHQEEIKKGDQLTVIKKVTTTIVYNQVPEEIINKYIQANKLDMGGNK